MSDRRCYKFTGYLLVDADHLVALDMLGRLKFDLGDEGALFFDDFHERLGKADGDADSPE